MRIEIVKTWILVGFCLLIIGTLLHMFEITEDGKFLAVMGLVYFGIGVLLSLVHDHHMTKRTRAGRRRE